MKLHLPVSLFKCLMSLLPVVAAVTLPAQAATMHRDVSIITYTDYGQNSGRYVTDASANSLLQYIRQQEGGVVLTYTGGQGDYALEHGMIDFGSSNYIRRGAAVSYSAMATVGHQNPGLAGGNFSSTIYGVGDEHCINYKSIAYQGSSAFSSVTPNGWSYTGDAAVVRLSKVITDAPVVSMYDTSSKSLSNLTYYTSGAGDMKLGKYTNYSDIDTLECWDAKVADSQSYAIGGIMTGNLNYTGSGSNKGIKLFASYQAGDVNTYPLPWRSENGDSGCAIYVWDEQEGYQYIASNYGHDLAAGTPASYAASDVGYINSVLQSRTVQVEMTPGKTVYLNAVTTEGEQKSDGTHSTTLYRGSVEMEGASSPLQFVGVQSGLSTWGNLGGLKDTQNWYNYGDSYLLRSTEDLFYTENLVFSSSGNNNKIVLNATVDLGIGYAQFSLAEGASSARYDISSAGNGGYQFNHAGYVIDDGVEVHTTLTGDASHMYEWRKVGEGDLYIEGTGNNNILLNVGGSGRTYLNRAQGSYAAYNVLVNNGATIVISDADQIKRDLTFGNRGGTLELNGQSMYWYNTSETESENRTGFSIHALTDDAIIANTAAGTASTLTYKEGSENTFLGSFVDSANSSLKIEHDADGTWTLHSVRTNLQHANSGLQVNQGTVVLRGTNTVHGTGSATGTSAERYFSEDDWHYADATMNVSVQNGGTFELGSHALLTGTVTVESGGTYVMRESVRHQMEYVEGGQILEDTSKYSAFFGHKGNVQLNGGTFAVQFNEGVDSTLYYDRAVTGSGAMTVDTGTDGGTLNFSGTVETTVSKTLERGQLVLSGAAAADRSNKWLVNAGGVMVQFDDVYDTLDVIDSASTGSIGLKEGVYAEQFDFSATHGQLGIGALSGATVQYGEAGTTEQLSSIKLGGGGKLVVNYQLAGTESLNVDAGSMSGGEIHLANVAANYSGVVNVQAAGGSITLTTAQAGVLNGATVNLNDGGIWKLGDNQNSVSGTVNVNAGGILQGKDMDISGTVNVNAGGVLRGENITMSGNSVELFGALEYDSFIVQNGATLNLRSGGRLDADNAVTIGSSGIMRLNLQTLQDKVELRNGGIMYGNGGTIGSTAYVKATEGTGYLSAGGGTMTINGHIGAEEGAVLRLESGTMNLHANTINADGGVLQIACGVLSLQSGQGSNSQSILGTLQIASDVTIKADKNRANNAHNDHFINHLHIDTGKTLILQEIYESWTHTWDIAKLTGQGNIEWLGNGYWYNTGTSRMLLTGENDFSGKLIVKQQYNGWDSLNDYSMQQVELAHDNAAKNMVISLIGDNNSQPGLAINTANARIRGVEATTDTFLYAGPVKTNGQNSPTSSALNTLTITGDENYTFAGAVLGDATNGLNIVMDGSGTQTFTNAANVVHDVMALQGSLVFTNLPTIHGDVSIAQGANLTLGSGTFSLDAGRTLHVLAGAAGEPAVLNNSLVLNGGTIAFGSYDASGAALSLNGKSASLTEGNTLNLLLANLSAARENTAYLLAAGDWSAFEGKVNIIDSGYMTATVTATSEGLKTSAVSLKEGYTGWKGDASVLSESAKVVFGDFNGVTSAELSASASIGEGYFDNTADFTVSGASLSMSRLEKSGSGTLVVNSDVSATNMVLKESALISGTGSLSVGNLTLQDDIVTEVDMGITSLNCDNSTRWTIQGGQVQMSFEDAHSLLGVEVAEQGELLLQMAGAQTISSSIGGAGKVSLTGGGSLTKENDAVLNLKDAELAGAVFKGNGAVHVSGDVDISGMLSLAKGAVYLENGADVTVTTLRAGDTANDQPTELTIGEGASLTVTGASDVDGTGTSFLLTHWRRSDSSLLLNGGTLTAKDTCLQMGWDSSGCFEARSGTATLKGIRFRTRLIYQGDVLQPDTFILGDARLNIGSGGITGFTTDDTVVLGNGTIAATADFHITPYKGGTIQLTGDTIFDTNGLSIWIDAAMYGEGGLSKKGNGTLYLNAGNSFSGDVSIEGGILQINQGQCVWDYLSAAGTNFHMAAGTELALNHSLGSVHIAGLTGSGKLKKDSDGTLFIQGDAELSSALIKGKGTTTISSNLNVTGLLDFGTETVVLAEGANVTANGLRLGTSAEGQNTSLTIGEGARLTVKGTNIADTEANSILLAHWKRCASTLALEGGTLDASGTVMHMGWDSGGTFKALAGEAYLKGVLFRGVAKNNNDASFILGTETTGSACINIGSEGIKGFKSNDTVKLGNGTLAASDNFSITGNNVVNLVGAQTGTIFDTNEHTITIDAVLVGGGNLTKQGSGTLYLMNAANTYSGTTTVSAGTLKAAALIALGSSSIVVEKDATLEVEEISNGISFDNGKLSGQGLVVLNLSGETYQNVNLGSFSGETYVKSGSLSMNKATVGNTLRLADGVKLQASGTLAADLVLEGQTLVTPAGAANFNGTVTGNGTFVHESNQYFYFNKEVTLGGWVHDDGNTWGRDYFNAKADIGTVSLDGGHMYFYKGSVLGSLEVKQKNQQSLAEFSADSEHTVGTLSLENGIINANGTVEIGTYTQTGGTFTAAGSVVVKGRLNGTAGDIALKGGELKLSYTGEEGNSIYLLDGSGGGTAAGTLRLGQKVNLTVSSQIWGRSASSIVLEAGATLTSTEDGVIISNPHSETEAKLVSSGNNNEYSVSSTEFELINGHLKYDSSSEKTLTNKLTNSVIENANRGKAKLIVDNAANSLRGIVASGGNMDVLNQAALSLDILEVAGGKTVGLYTGADAASSKAAVSVSDSATFGAGAVLNTACLTLADGATLEIVDVAKGSVSLNGALTFGSGLKLGEKLLASVGSLDYGQYRELFTGVSEFALPAVAATESSRVLASSVFSNVQSESLYVEFHVVDNVGSLMVINVPEPSTTTLGLLALAGLCARRRRK